jgi:hypothetical protein
MRAAREVVVDRSPLSGRTTDLIDGVTYRYAHLFSRDYVVTTCLELTQLMVDWRKHVQQGDFRGALALVELTVGLMLDTLTELVEKRAALARKKEERDAAQNAVLRARRKDHKDAVALAEKRA